MAEYMIQGTTLTAIGDAIREKNGTTATMTPAEMAEAISGISTGFPNGREWTACTFDKTPNNVKKIIKGANMYVLGTLNNRELFYSEDGKAWKRSNELQSSVNDSCNDIVYANGMWVASMQTGVYYSTDGKTWTPSNLVADPYYNTEGALLYANGLWVTLFHGDKSGVNDIYYSADGKTWTLSNLVDIRYTTLAYGNGVWVATGGANISTGAAYSTDGTTWTQSNITDKSLMKPVYAETGIWVTCCGYSNERSGLYYSTDGKTWTQSNITVGNALWSEGVKYGNGMWMASIVGYVDDLSTYATYYSTDGKTWTQTDFDASLYPVYGNGVWLVSSTDGPYYSADCVTWTKCEGFGDVSYATFYATYASSIWYNNGFYSVDNGQTWHAATNGRQQATHIDNMWFSYTQSNELYYSVTWEPN